MPTAVSPLRPTSARYDTRSGILTVRLTSMTAGRWAEYEYRDLPADVADRVTCAGYRLRAVLAADVAGRYAVRRRGTDRWTEPPAQDEA